MINKTTLKTLDILEFIASSTVEPTITDISKKLNLPRSSVDDIVKALTYKKYLSCNKHTKTYTLGIEVLELSLKMKNKIGILDIITPFLKQLLNQFNDTIFFAIKDENEIIYLSKFESSKAVRTTAILGSRKQLYCTGLGKAILSAYSPSELDNYLSSINLVPKTPYTIVSKQKLLLDIHTAQQNGYSIDYREGDIDVLCVAAPIYVNKTIYGAISIASLYTSITEKDIILRGAKIKETAQEISKLLNYF